MLVKESHEKNCKEKSTENESTTDKCSHCNHRYGSGNVDSSPVEVSDSDDVMIEVQSDDVCAGSVNVQNIENVPVNHEDTVKLRKGINIEYLPTYGND